MTGMRSLGSFLVLVGLVPFAGAPPAMAQQARFDGIDSAPAERMDAWTARVDPWVLETVSRDDETEFLVFLAEQADLSEASQLGLKEAKGWYVFQTLSRFAERTQAPIRRELERLGVNYQPYWVANMIWVRGGASVIEAMARRPDVARVSANPSVAMDLPMAERAPPRSALFPDVEPNIQTTGAPDVFWESGVFGEGAVIGGQDTGYDWDHSALIDTYRGNGLVVDHNYNWHDAVHSGGGVCGADSPEPCDDHGHGTHTMGTMTGFDGGDNWVGMAPAARWIGCRNMNVGSGTPTTYSECFQWFIAPTDLDGANPDPSRAPHVINNSWLCPPSEGCTDPNLLKTVVENTRAAGILVVVSAGNSGSGCSTVSSPTAIYEESFTVGATNNSDNIVSFSSRGPVTVDGSERLKPDISAPGLGIRSAAVGGGYTFLSGTSMAAPHVAGMAGLLVSAAPCWAGDPTQLEQHIIDWAQGLTTTQSCGSVPGSAVPNNTYGYGAMRSRLPGVTCPDVMTLSFDQWVLGGVTEMTVTDAEPDTEVSFYLSTAGPGRGLCAADGSGCLDIRSPVQMLGASVADSGGTATFLYRVRPVRSGRPAFVGDSEPNLYFQAMSAQGVKSNLLVVPPSP